MEPLVYRGDLLFLTNYDTPVRVGDIVVFNVADKEIPIVHRVIKIHEGFDNFIIFYESLILFLNNFYCKIFCEKFLLHFFYCNKDL
jgi:signal peptidase I